MKKSLSLFSDGGGLRDRHAASACLLYSESGALLLPLVAYLGGGTNNEAEIFSGLMGFASLDACGYSDIAEVRWVSDSEYALKSATQYIHNWQRNGWKTAAKKPVKNQGLWKAFLAVAGKVKITPEHVAGHSGHPENEACDSIATWVQKNAIEQFAAGAEVLVTRERVLEHNARWLLIDARPVIDLLRCDEPDHTQALLILRNLISEALTCKEDSVEPMIQADSLSDVLIVKLKKLRTEALALSSKDLHARQIADSLTKLLEELSKH